MPTRNAARWLPDCLASVAWADEIVVVDRFSDDDTVAVCEAVPNCRVFRREGTILGNQNFGFEQVTSDWILRLDADERVTPELAREIQGLLRAPPADVTGWECWERIFVLGRELRHGFGRRHYRKMLFRTGAGRYPERSEHDDLETSGTWLQTEHGYLHYNYSHVRDYLTKCNYYTDTDTLNVPLGAKPPSMVAAVRETARHGYLYYLKFGGFRDGWVGFVDAGMRAFYHFVTWAKLRERWEIEHAHGDDRAARRARVPGQHEQPRAGPQLPEVSPGSV